MITSQDKQLISRLIKKYAGNISTESMIAFVADTNGVLAVCRTLVNSNNNDDQFTISWVDEQCHNRKVDVRGFLYEVEQILSIFQPGHKIDAHYAILELEDGASDEEIKHAYRKLSRKYHPDTASSDDPNNADMFVKITKAYHALMEEESGNENIVPLSPSVNHWREQKTHHVSRARKKKNILWFAALASVMIVISLVVAKKYREKAMIAGFQSSRAAFIPPASAIQATETVSDLVEQSALDETTENLKPNLDETALLLDTKTVETGKIPEQEKTQSVIETLVKVKQTPPEKESVKKERAVKKKARTEIEKERPKEVVQQEKKKSIAQPIEKLSAKKQMVVESVQQKPAEPTEKEIQERTQKKIEGFLSEYTKSYKDKDLLAFTRFFALQATENGKPLAEILPTYLELFQSSETVSLSVSILKWKKNIDTIQLDGRFRINILYKNGQKVQGAGVIVFLLIDTEKQLSIKEMKYQFDK